MVDLHEKATVILFIVLRYNVFVIAVLEIANGLRPKFEAEDISHYSSHLFDCDMTVMFNDTLQSIRNRFLQTFSTITSGPLSRLSWEWHRSRIAVKHDSHLFERVSLSLWIGEERRQAVDDQDDHKDNVVFPSDSLEGDRIDENVETYSQHSRHIGNCKATGAKTVGPDFAGVGVEQGRQRDIVTGEKDEQERDDRDADCWTLG
jgi:hypothetical protein